MLELRLAQWRRVEVMELVPPLPPGVDQPGGLEDVEVLGDPLPRGGQAVLGGQPCADLEQGLAVALDQLVENRPSGRIGECLEHVDIGHPGSIGK